MTDTQYQTLLTEVGLTRGDIATLDKTCAITNHDVKALSRRVTAVEIWQDDRDDKAEATGRHELVTLRAEVASRRKRWTEFGFKVAILLVGAAVASVGGAIAQNGGF